MRDQSQHLTEDERQSFADGSATSDGWTESQSHIALCPDCAADVARIQRLLSRVGKSRVEDAPLDDMWKSVRGRIDQAKQARISAGGAVGGRRRRDLLIAAGIAVAAGILIAIGLTVGRLMPQRAAGPVPSSPPVASATTAAPGLTAVLDSEREYQQEAQTLLNRLELDRSLLRPEASRSAEHDLAVVDSAITELKSAVAHDPRNAALHQLLAASYKQKADLLRRIADAG